MEGSARIHLQSVDSQKEVTSVWSFELEISPTVEHLVPSCWHCLEEVEVMLEVYYWGWALRVKSLPRLAQSVSSGFSENS